MILGNKWIIILTITHEKTFWPRCNRKVTSVHSIDTKKSPLCSILLRQQAVKWRRSKIKFSKSKKVETSNFELLKCFMPQKKAENMYNSDLARKSKISCKKINSFFDFSIFHQRLEDPWKFLTFNFPKLSKKNSKNDLSGTCQVLRGTKSKVLGSLTLALRKWQMDLRWCGMIWPPPSWNRVNRQNENRSLSVRQE